MTPVHAVLAILLAAQAVPKKSYVYKEVGALRIELDVHRPETEDRLPVLVWIHGGALLMGSRGGVPGHLLSLSKAEGFALVSIDYRLAPHVKAPEIVGDVKDALAWVTGRGAELARLDPKRVVVSGGSAGGYLTLMSGVAADPKPAALVAFWGYGDVDGDWYTKPSEFYRKRPLVAREQALQGLGETPVAAPPDKAQAEARSRYYLYLRQNGLWTREVTGLDPEKDRARLDALCPARAAGPSYPPTLLIHGTEDTDVPYDRSVEMARTLERLKVAHELVTVPGGGHGLTGVDRKLVDEANAKAHAFIRRFLRP
jgi:acetyl esterase/lipase